MNDNAEQIAMEICRGAIDMHIHSSPDLIPRKFDDIELAQHSAETGMAAILIKNHFESTASRAWLVQKVIGKGLSVFGGCVLNRTVGGLNLEAVDAAINLGAKEIWMPTIHAKNHLLKIRNKNSKKGIYILDEQGKLLSVVHDILELIAKSGVILGTGHLSNEEIAILVKEARRKGVEKIVITHPEWWIVDMPLSLQLELCKERVYFERCMYCLTEEGNRRTPFSTIVSAIRKVGVENTVLATDLGQYSNPTPVSGLVWYVAEFLKAGFKREELDIMLKRNPSGLLGITKGVMEDDKYLKS